LCGASKTNDRHECNDAWTLNLKILIISQWFTPEPTFKGLAFALELVSRGHQVEVLTGFPNYPGGNVYKGYKICMYQHEIMQGIDVHRVPLYPNHDQSAIKRAVNYITFALSASVAINFVTSRPDVAYVYHPPLTTSLPAMAQKIFRGVPFVYDVQDLWPDTLTATGMIHKKWQLSIISKWCDLVYRSASVVTVLSDGFKDALVKRGVPEKKVRVIHNWCEESPLSVQIRPTVNEPAWFQGRFTVMFAGNFGKAQALETVLKAAAAIEHLQPRIQFVLVGSGVEEERLREQVLTMGLTNVLFHDRLPMGEMRAFMQHADALLVSLRADPLFKITIPSKTQAYMAAGKPIIMAVAGEAAELVTRARCGVTCEPENAAELARVVLDLANRSSAELDMMGLAGRSYYAAKLSLKTGTDRFLEVFEELTSANVNARGNHGA
jgi:colanic acid biosynthesis glycosyl transferase WcaI